MVRGAGPVRLWQEARVGVDRHFAMDDTRTRLKRLFLKPKSSRATRALIRPSWSLWQVRVIPRKAARADPMGKLQIGPGCQIPLDGIPLFAGIPNALAVHADGNEAAQVSQECPVQL